VPPTRKKSKAKSSSKHIKIILGLVAISIFIIGAVAIKSPRFRRNLERKYHLAIEYWGLSNSQESIQKQQIKPKQSNYPYQISRVFEMYPDYYFGIDISHYQGVINWKKIGQFDNKKPISFIIFRASMSQNIDKHYKRNNAQCRKKGIKMGAYHFFSNHISPEKQAQIFIAHAQLKPGDLRPILDVEKSSVRYSHKNLQKNVRKILDILEVHYRVKPIIYCGDNFFNEHLKSEVFLDYPLWIANYNLVDHPSISEWSIWQFSETAKIEGVNTKVDFNVINNEKSSFESLTLH